MQELNKKKGPWEGKAGPHRLVVVNLKTEITVIKEHEDNFKLENIWLLFYIHNCTNLRYLDFFKKNSVNYTKENYWKIQIKLVYVIARTQINYNINKELKIK